MRHKQDRRGLIRGLASTTILAGGALFVGGMQAAAQTPPAPASAPAAAPAPKEDTLQEVVVTSEKRVTDVQHTPTAIQSIGGDDLAQQGVVEVRDLQKLVPGLNIQQSGAYTQFFIRGVGSPVTSPLGDPAVSFNLDGVYIATPTGTHSLFYDIQRVEVLKGPQGTLYGRNATAGDVNVVTNRPSFEDSAEVSLQVGDYSDVEASGYVNHPINDELAIRLAGQSVDRDGYLTDGHDDAHTKAARAELLWKPSDETSLLVTGDFAHETGVGPNAVFDPYVDPGNPFVGPSDPRMASKFSPSSVFEYGKGDYIDNTNYGVAIDLEQELSFADLSALVSHREADIRDQSSIAGFLVLPDSQSRQESVELRLASKGDTRFKWLVGFYYFDGSTNEDSINDIVDLGSLSSIVSGSRTLLAPYTDESYAFFTQESFAITDQLRITAGLRYTDEDKNENGQATLYSGAAIVVPQNASLSFDKVNYRVGLDYDITDTSMIYANISTGFKAGGFNPGASPSAVNTLPNTYQPEELTSYTLGVKNRFLNNHLQVNLEAFYWDYDNRQYYAFQTVNTGRTPTPGDPIGLATINTAKAHVDGIEFDTSYRATADDLFTLAGDFIPEAIADKFEFKQVFIPPPGGCRTVGPSTYNCDGASLPNTARWSGTFGYQHFFELPNDATLIGEFQGHFQSDWYGDFTRNAATEQPAYVAEDIALTYQAPGDKWEFTGYIRNLTDETIKVQALAAPSTPNASFADLAPPRTFGVRAVARF